MTTPAPESTEPNEPQETSGDPTDLGEGGKSAIRAEREARKAAEKKVATYEAQIAEIERSKLSDLERAQAAAAEYQTAAEKATAEALRWRIAARHGISDDDAETFLTGSTEESLTKQAERLASLASNPHTPRPDPSQGAKGSGASQTTAQQFASAMQGHL